MSTSLLRLTCPQCKTALGLKTAPPGGRCKCPKCGATISTVQAPPPPIPADRPLTVLAANPPPAAADRPLTVLAATPPPVKPAPKKAAPPMVQKSPAPKTAPARPKKATPAPAPDKVKKGNTTFYLVGGGALLVAGFLGLILLGGIIGVGAWALKRKKSSDSKLDQQASATANFARDPIPESPPPVVKEESPKTPPVKPDPPPPLPADPGDGSLPRTVLEKTKQATLLIKVKMGNGDQGSGSGFFEETSGLVITNAHVVGMLDPKDKPPQKIEAVLNSGLPNSVTIPAKLIAVDRTSDLAILDVPLPPVQANSQSKLAVGLAKDLQETQRVYVCGFPLGERANKNVTINTTTVSSLHRGNDGVVTKVQVNGGMDHGNSGGPVIDTRGNVIGVSFSGYEGTQLKFAIPGESVRALLEGRISTIAVANDAVARDGKFMVPISVQAIDPRKRITRVVIEYWTAPTNQPAPPPSDKQPTPGNLSSTRQSVQLVYDAATGKGQGELVLNAMPENGKCLWVQPVVTNGTGKPAWLAGIAYPSLAGPVDAKPAMLKAQYRLGTVPVHLTSTANYKLKRPGDDEHSLLMNIDTRLIEETKSLLAPAGAQVRIGLDKQKRAKSPFVIGLSLDREKVETTPEFQQAIGKDVGVMVLDYQVDGQGNLTSKKTDFTRPVAKDPKEILTDIGKQLHQSFEVVATPQLGNQMQPGQPWQAKRELPVPMMLDLKPIMMDVTYTLRGVRQHRGREVAVVDLRGTAKEGNQSGKMSGTVLIDPQMGMVVQANAKVESTLTVVIRRGRTVLSYQAIGTLEVKLQRGNDID